MTQRRILQDHLLPILLGSSSLSHRLAWRIYFQCGIVSYVCDTRKRMADRFNPTCRFFPVQQPHLRDMTAHSLCYLASDPEFLPILIPCTREYQHYVAENAPLLESRFLIRTPEELLQKPPLSLL